MRRVFLTALANARDLAALAAFLAVAVGLWWERPSLALIVPGALVFGCLAWGHVAGRRE